MHDKYLNLLELIAEAKSQLATSLRYIIKQLKPQVYYFKIIGA
jgi:hypothetical protein